MNIKDLRKSVGLTQKELGDIVGKPDAYIADLESGKRNIRNISAETLIKIAEALGTTAEFILTTPEYIDISGFEWDKVFDRGDDTDYMLVVDNIKYDQRYNRHIYNINGQWYKMIDRNGKFTKSKPVEEQLLAINIPIELPQGEHRIDLDCRYSNCVPRGGFEVPLGREITKTELDEIINKYHLTEDDMSGEFTDKKGDIYGKYAKIYTSIQLRLEDPAAALRLESDLSKKGIEAKNIAECRLNIRIR